MVTGRNLLLVTDKGLLLVTDRNVLLVRGHRRRLDTGNRQKIVKGYERAEAYLERGTLSRARSLFQSLLTYWMNLLIFPPKSL